MVDLDSDPSKLLDVVEIGKQLLVTRGALTTFSLANDVAKYFAILPAVFAAGIPSLAALDVMNLSSPTNAVLAALIFNALVIPAGLAFEEAYRRRPDIKLHIHDGSHPTLLGTYLAACTIYATVYNRPCSGNSYDSYGQVSKEDATFLQQVADDTVRKFFGR